MAGRKSKIWFVEKRPLAHLYEHLDLYDFVFNALGLKYGNPGSYRELSFD